MKLNEAIQEAANEKDPFLRRQRIEEAVNFMRFRLGLNSDQCRTAAVKSGVPAERWEELLAEVDNPGL